MGDDDEGLLVLAVELLDEVHDGVGVFGIEIAGGLVAPDDGGLIDEGAGDGDALALAAGELGGLVLGPVAQLHEVERGFGFLAGLAGLGARHE